MRPAYSPRHRARSFRWVLGFVSAYLAVLVVLPLGALVCKLGELTRAEVIEIVLAERTLSAIWLSFRTAAAAALMNAGLGLVVAWVLARMEFPGRRWLDALIDLPLALPTAVAGIALTTLLTPEGWVGRYFERWGVQVAFAPLGIAIALTFVGFPFVVRSIQPIIADLDPDVEEAAHSLGASRWSTFRRVLWPEIAPALATGGLLAFARGLGEYGSVVFISGNMPYQTEVVPLLIVSELEQYDSAAAAVLATVTLVLALGITIPANLWLGRLARRGGD
ncbi:MAG: sulfate ABC transporter permease subunit CysT [Deltaproteobacteria bacterium]|nr:sulfate ABC transporter permease subunit CysT [Deltaproteobacteria bacterium]